MNVKWTDAQQQVIDLRDRDLLVSAAAGSGKTAVLVERIIQKVLDAGHPVDIDRMLVVTFTKAAAAEMRERVAKAISARMDEDAGNAYLNRQYTLVHHAQITTIDSFCLYIVKNYFQCIDLEPGFRVGDQGELSLLGEDVLAEVLERWYASEDPQFTAFMDDYASAKSDAPVAQMIRKLYEYSTSYPWQKEWLRGLAQPYDPQALTPEALADENSWLQELLRELHAVLEGERLRLVRAKQLCEEPDGPDMYTDVIVRVLEQMEGMEQIRDYDELGLAVAKLDFGRLPVRRGYTGDMAAKELVQKLRNQVKDDVQKLYKKYFSLPLAQQLEELADAQAAVQMLARLTMDYADAYETKKRERGLLDFSDIEHMALRILVDEQTKEPTAVARELQAQFEEVMIDEYQDSNYVQEAILSAVSGGAGRANRFMVGDVKQSIYRFRLARPELFMEKYDSFTHEPSEHQKICLDQNFRSRAQVLDSVNDLFEQLMKRDIGGVEYDDEARLRVGAAYPPLQEKQAYKSRILLTDRSAQALEAAGADSARALEAAMIAEEISRLMDTQISDGNGGLRQVRYSDIVILLRSPGSWGAELTEQLAARGIPSHRMSQTGYFAVSEVQTVLSLCHVIDNPLQDIPLAAVLSSPFYAFADEELAKIRLCGTHAFFYQHITDYAQNGEDAGLREKCRHFLDQLADYRERARHLGIHDLLDWILREHDYFHLVRALPAGEKRLANVEMLLRQAVAFEKTSYRGLFSFIRYMEQLQKYEVDFGEADVSGEQDDVVRIMSIHKSKGLEFPIVFVSGMGSRFNKKDSTDLMILDSTYGIGLSRVQGKRHRKHTTLLKEMIASRIARENIGEEMRVLYVALTRAREQLILTGTLNNPESALMDYEIQAETPLSFLDRRDAGCYFDWVLSGAYRHPEHLELVVYDAADFALRANLREAQAQLQKEQLLEMLTQADEESGRRIAERFAAVYPYAEEVTMRSKVSVSELKHKNMRFEPEDTQALAWYAKEEQKELAVPRFLSAAEDERQSDIHPGALRGSAMHRMMECLDYGDAQLLTDEGAVDRQLERLQVEGRISREQAELVNTQQIRQFLQLPLAERIMQAHNQQLLSREQPFMMGVPASQTDPAIHSEQTVLVQGIIDLYFEEADGLVLLDYKTDSVTNAGQLIDRYQTQMDLYAQALTAATGKPVREKLIYSFRLGELIAL